MKRWMWRLGGGFIVVAIVGIIGVLVISRGVATDDPQSQENKGIDAKQFPQLTGNNLMLSASNLQGEELTVPQDLGSGLKLIVVAYDSDQQSDVEEWLEPLEDLTGDFPELSGYYIPLLPKSAADAALFIIGGMSLGAGSDENRERTIVVFTDVEKFNELVEVEGIDEVRLFLVGADDVILWETAGRYSEEKIGELREALEGLR